MCINARSIAEEEKERDGGNVNLLVRSTDADVAEETERNWGEWQPPPTGNQQPGNNGGGYGGGYGGGHGGGWLQDSQKELI